MKKKMLIILILVVGLLVLFTACKKVTTIEFTVDRNSCNGCGRCIQTCPFNAIELNDDGKAVIDQTLCQQDGACVKICPQNAIY